MFALISLAVFSAGHKITTFTMLRGMLKSAFVGLPWFVITASPGRETTTSQAAVNSKQAGHARTGGRKLRSDSEQDLLQSKQQLLAHLSEFVRFLMCCT